MTDLDVLQFLNCEYPKLWIVLQIKFHNEIIDFLEVSIKFMINHILVGRV